MITISPETFQRIQQAADAFQSAGLNRPLAGVLAAAIVHQQPCTQFALEHLANLNQPQVSKGTSEAVRRGWMKFTLGPKKDRQSREKDRGQRLYSLAIHPDYLLTTINEALTARQKSAEVSAKKARHIASGRRTA